jgi:hypothetical protein
MPATSAHLAADARRSSRAVRPSVRQDALAIRIGRTELSPRAFAGARQARGRFLPPGPSSRKASPTAPTPCSGQGTHTGGEVARQCAKPAAAADRVMCTHPCHRGGAWSFGSYIPDLPRKGPVVGGVAHRQRRRCAIRERQQSTHERSDPLGCVYHPWSATCEGIGPCRKKGRWGGGDRTGARARGRYIRADITNVEST